MATPKPVPAIDRYDNGQVRFRGANLDGKMHGPWKFFRRDGSLMRSGSFERGKQIGVWRTFDRAGKIVKKTAFSGSNTRDGGSLKKAPPGPRRTRLVQRRQSAQRLSRPAGQLNRGRLSDDPR